MSHGVVEILAEAVFAGSGISIKDSTPFRRPVAAKCACAIVQAATHSNDSKVLLEVSEDLAGAMKGRGVPGFGRIAYTAEHGMAPWRTFSRI